MHFGQKLRKLREEKSISQYELAEKLGYVTNSYIWDYENGAFIPSEEKLKKIAKALKIPTSQIKDLLLETRLESMGIKEPELQELVKDFSRLSKNDKKRIIGVYIKIKEKLKKEDETS